MTEGIFCQGHFLLRRNDNGKYTEKPDPAAGPVRTFGSVDLCGNVLLCAWLLSPVYGFLAAGIGSGLADLFAGYAVYVPATFVIKGLMAVVACYGFRFLRKAMGSIAAMIVAGILAEIVMVLGYYIFEGFLYGFVESLVNIPANAVQGVAGVILGVTLNKIFEKTNLFIKT